MNIQLSWKLDGDSALEKFICDLIIEGLTVLAMEEAPELVEEDLFAEKQFETLCADAADDSEDLSQRSFGDAAIYGLGSF